MPARLIDEVDVSILRLLWERSHDADGVVRIQDLREVLGESPGLSAANLARRLNRLATAEMVLTTRAASNRPGRPPTAYLLDRDRLITWPASARLVMMVHDAMEGRVTRLQIHEYARELAIPGPASDRPTTEQELDKLIEHAIRSAYLETLPDGALTVAQRGAAEHLYLKDLAARAGGTSESVPDAEDDPTDPLGSRRRALRSLAETIATQIAENPRALEGIEWRDLERALGEVFQGLGFDVDVTRPSKDGGKDLIIHWSSEGISYTWYVEIKHWRENRVGATTMRQFVQIVVRDRVDRGLLLSSSGFVPGAYEALTIVERKRLSLGDGVTIQNICKTYIRTRAGIWTPDNPLQIFDEGQLWNDTAGGQNGDAKKSKTGNKRCHLHL